MRQENNLKYLYNKINTQKYSIDLNNKNRILLKKKINNNKQSTRLITSFRDFGLDWEDFDIHIDEYEPEKIKTIYKNWEIEIQKIDISRLTDFQHNFLFKFGSDDALFDYNIQEDTQIYESDFILYPEKHKSDFILYQENTTSDTVKCYYGILLYNSNKLTEIMDYNIKVKLNLSFNNSLIFDS